MVRRIALAVLIVGSMALAASAENYQIDPGHSSVGFTVTHLAVSRVRGNFDDFSGSVVYDPANVSKSAVDVTIQTASINTKSENRDGHLKSSDFFAADSFPTITFKSTAVTPKADGNFDLLGNLTMHGVTKPVTLAVTTIGVMNDPKMGKLVGFTATGRLNRQDYGVSWSNMLEGGGLMVGNDVWLDIEIEAHAPKEKK